MSTMEAKELENMASGFKYFEDWCLDVRAAGVNPDSTTQTSFLAWQVKVSVQQIGNITIILSLIVMFHTLL